MYRFRALAYHAPLPRGDLDSYISQLRVGEAGELARELSKRREVWTVRAVSPPAREAAEALGVSLEKYVEAFYEEARRTAGYVAFPLSSLEPSLLAELAASYERAYFSAPYSTALENAIVEALRKLPEEAGWVAGSRFAVAFGGAPVTAYFPATTSEGEGFTLSLLYPNHVAEELERGKSLPEALRSVALEAYRLAHEAREAAGSSLKLLGIDLSLSPWERESVAALLEKLLGLPLFSPGTQGVLHLVNTALSSTASTLEAVGFNEVMLPLAEDARLKELAAVGQLRLRDLVAATFTCVAGLDMVPIPSTAEDSILKGLMRDLAAAHAVKNRKLGMRLILVDAEPGEEVDLGMFGKTPVLDPLQ
ncbi:MAG: DUF711 family protein [Thermofilum sp.]